MQDNPNIKKLNVTTQILLIKLHTGNINKSYSHIDHTVYIIIFTNEKLNNAKCSQKESKSLEQIFEQNNKKIDFEKSVTECLIKACVCYFYQFFIFSPNDSPSKTM